MRTLLTILLACLCLSAYAAQPDTPSPSSATPADAADAPEVTITRHAEQTIEEYRIGGQLYMIKVTPKDGVPYYLVDDLGDGKFARQESLDSGLRVPRWVIKRF